MVYARKTIVLLPTIFFTIISWTDEYIYPVAHFTDSNGDHTLMIHQLDVETMELYDVNPSTKRAEKILSTMHMPAAVKLLPSKKGFSFVDNGRIKIKDFLKRSPKMLDIFEPIYGIELIEWLNDQICYFHAYSDNRSNLYELTVDGDLSCIAQSGACDYSYPQIINDQLWFIGKKLDCDIAHFFIGQAAYEPGKPATDIHEIITFESVSLVLLHMVSPEQGYVIGLPATLDNGQSVIQFSYYSLAKIADSWQKEFLFVFDVPYFMLFDQTKRLYESLLPFRPCQKGSLILYSSFCAESGRLAIYCYDALTHEICSFCNSEADLVVPMVYTMMK